MLDVDAVDAPAFVLEDALASGLGPTHVHARHQLLYAASGYLRLREGGEGARDHALPPHRAAWIPAGCAHAVEVRRPSALTTAYFDPAAFDPAAFPPAAALAVFPMPPVGRELLLYARRWGPDHVPSPTGRSCFGALARLAGEWAAAPQLSLPRARTLELRRALAALEEELARPWTLDALARRAGLSARTLSRRMKDELGEGLRAYLGRLRVHAALERLASPGASVSAVAADLGFASPSAFAQAFRRHVGETPSAYARRASP
ncbi:MAG TPA: AraC family transcriptional regulator [Polyangiaceae bacterium LLY-WYZ-15_(1-7)]|nr:AraC family transcriptional regulator [Polyangiaceae bacterium LLY-WYZ-15_(1-7)]HJL09280.1 AraC family transcriptional regulator [Polyangiaceae bacterium LLY-WYZ-15_(1-7)]HJL32790.1 AraC family transcriptional regulator [Polyangiaceae bacterium LLY-WYZ-15_(1-7)]